jgi:SAM-dependent methyltransferase
VRHRSAENYRAFQEIQGSRIAKYLAQNGIQLAGLNVLDLGSGLGGYSQVFGRLGARVTALDLMRPPYSGQMQFKGLFAWVQGDAERTPFAANSFEFVFCASLIEHLPNPLHLIKEIERLLLPDGVAYISFPPYFSPRGGHQYSPFHYLGERLALRLLRNRIKYQDWVSCWQAPVRDAHAFSELYAGWGLYRMTIRRFRNLIHQTNFILMDASTRYLPINTVQWPLLGEVLTWHAQFLLRKAARRE